MTSTTNAIQAAFKQSDRFHIEGQLLTYVNTKISTQESNTKGLGTLVFVFSPPAFSPEGMPPRVPDFRQ